MKIAWTTQRVMKLTEKDISLLTVAEKRELSGYTSHQLERLAELMNSASCNDALKKHFQKDIEALRKVNERIIG